MQSNSPTPCSLAVMKDKTLILRLALYSPSPSVIVMLNVSSAPISTELLLHVMSAVGLALSVSHMMLTRPAGDTSVTGNRCVMVTFLAGTTLREQSILLINQTILTYNI